MPPQAPTKAFHWLPPRGIRGGGGCQIRWDCVWKMQEGKLLMRLMIKTLVCVWNVADPCLWDGCCSWKKRSGSLWLKLSKWSNSAIRWQGWSVQTYALTVAYARTEGFPTLKAKYEIIYQPHSNLWSFVTHVFLQILHIFEFTFSHL